MTLCARMPITDCSFKVVMKRNGLLEEFDLPRITRAVNAAFESIGQPNEANAARIAHKTADSLACMNDKILSVDKINQTVIKTLRSEGFDSAAFSFERYANERSRIRVMGAQQGHGSTDGFLMVTSISKEMSADWDRSRIIRSLVIEADLSLSQAERIAKEVENKIILSNFSYVTTYLIREIAHTELLKRSLHEAAEKYRNYSIPRSDLEEILFSKNLENSNIMTNNPEAVNFTISGRIGKEYALSSIFTKDVADAHTSGKIHLHDLDLPCRVYCSAHSLEYIKKFGLQLENLQTASAPAQHTSTLTGHLNTFFATMQTYYAGALGIGYMNILYAPLIKADLEEIAHSKIAVLQKSFAELTHNCQENSTLITAWRNQIEAYAADPLSILTDKEIDDFMMQKGQEVIFAASQNAFSRGGQTLFIDFNIHTGVPSYLHNTPSIEPGGKYALTRKGKKVFLDEKRLEQKTASGFPLIALFDPETGREVMREKLVNHDTMDELVQEWYLEPDETPITYGNYDGISRRFAKNLLRVWEKGDMHGQPFAFPKCDLHINEETFTDPPQQEVLQLATEIASKNGAPYFIFDRDEVSLAACCRLRTAIDDNYYLKHPESMRFCGFQNVTINLPQAAYRASENGTLTMDNLLNEIDCTIGLAIKAHLQKRAFIEQLQHPGSPQWLTGKISLDGVPYINLNTATYIIGLIGLNETIQCLTGKELHELSAQECSSYAVKIIAHMNIRIKSVGKQYGFKFSLEESPAESATRRLSKIDLRRYPQARNLIKGDIQNDQTFYTNSVHLRPDAPVDLLTRIELQSLFHPAIESGAIIHAFIGEEKPSPESIYRIIKKTFENTQSAQLTISPEFTICRECHTTHRGLHSQCPNCQTTDTTALKHMTRIVGYYSFIENWNPSKLSELDSRHEGNYSVMRTGDNAAERPHISNPTGGIAALSFGKSECPLCDDLHTVLTCKKLAEKYGSQFSVETYEVNTEEGLSAALIANINLSSLPALIILDEDNRQIFRAETKQGKPIELSAIEAALKNHFTHRSKAVL
ncbi:hypothetical protein KDK77_03425 [bacterium]|nr:hypothetical protein [bacterium]